MSIRVLLLTKKVPFPLRDGESVAINNMVLALRKQNIEVDLLTFNTSKHYTRIEDFPRHVDMYTSIASVELDNHVKIVPALTNLLGNKSYHIERFESEEFRDKLVFLLKNNSYDVIQLESIFLGPYLESIRQYTKAKVILRTHNVETLIWKRLSQSASIAKKQYLNIQVGRLEKYESQLLNQVDWVLPMSETDSQVLQKMGMSVDHTTIPISLDMSMYERREVTKVACSICFIGSLDWQPNIQGLLWFLNHIWPVIKKLSPDITCHVAGRNAHSDLISRLEKEGVVYHGEVPNAIDFIAQYEVMVVPLLSGSGQRVKILEALAMKVPVVATRIGAEGIAIQNDSSILLSDVPQIFAKKVVDLMKNESLKQKIALEGHKLIRDRYSAVNTGLLYKKVYTQ